jgi:hypothetical protein
MKHEKGISGIANFIPWRIYTVYLIIFLKKPISAFSLQNNFCNVGLKKLVFLLD